MRMSREHVSQHVLSDEELARYDRQIRAFGVKSQLKLKRSSVLIVGLGGLGTASALYLTAMGVGRLILVDPERVEISNLNRQILYGTKDLGRPKVEAAAERLRELNPNVEVETIMASLDEDLAHDVVKRADVVLDGLDNWRARFLLNRTCVELKRPLVHAGAEGARGQLMVVIPGVGPCLRCVFPERIAERRPIPVLGVTPGVLALLQVMEAVKMLTGLGEPSVGKLVVYDGYRAELRKIDVSRDPSCPVCSKVR